MKIEVGKSYINAIGDTIYIGNFYKGHTYPFEDTQDENTYTSDGKFEEGKDSDYDLICEVVPTLHEQYICGCISQKEFIEKHIEYWTENEQPDL